MKIKNKLLLFLGIFILMIIPKNVNALSYEVNGTTYEVNSLISLRDYCYYTYYTNNSSNFNYDYMYVISNSNTNYNTNTNTITYTCAFMPNTNTFTSGANSLYLFKGKEALFQFDKDFNLTGAYYNQNVSTNKQVPSTRTISLSNGAIVIEINSMSTEIPNIYNGDFSYQSIEDSYKISNFYYTKNVVVTNLISDFVPLIPYIIVLSLVFTALGMFLCKKD